MSLGPITITVASTDYVFDLHSVTNSQRIRLDTEHSSLALPYQLETSSQVSGKDPKVDRHLYKISLQKEDSVTGAVAAVTAHTVITVPRSPAISATDAQLAYALLRTGLTEAVAAEMISGKIV